MASENLRVRTLLFIGLLVIAQLGPARAQPPTSPGGVSVPWSQIMTSPTPRPAMTSREQSRRQKQLEEWQKAQQEIHHRSRPPVAPPSRPVEPPTPLLDGFAQAALLLTVGIGLFWGLFAFVHRTSGMGSGYYAPHKPDPGPIDRDQVRKFVNYAGVENGKTVYTVNDPFTMTTKQFKGESQWAMQVTARYEF